MEEEGIAMNQRRLVLVLFALVAVVVTCTLSLNQVIAGEKAKEVKEQAIEGTVVQTKSGVIVLETTWKSYGLTGMDLSKMLGSQVKVTGTVSTGKSGMIINVVKVEKIK
jgi:antitoxin component HigA of HigAB toxin-antitoxin module